jgi:hypothetical protein
LTSIFDKACLLALQAMTMIRRAAADMPGLVPGVHAAL